jgi:methyltransferase (TIGR00027 family)
MSSEPHRIAHVSDTALMTAACRALETERSDGWVRDPFARRLAGERGFAIADALPAREIMCLGVGMRSRILDDFIPAVIGERDITTVLSAGAGLDTRPWRLELPAAVRWIEVDLQPVLDYKSNVLASETPNCRLERLAVDLNDEAQRREMFARAIGERALIITEGLLMYLPAASVQALAAEAAASDGIAHWLLDVSSQHLHRAIQMTSFKDIEAVRAPDYLSGEAILRVLAEAGWTIIESRTYAKFGMSLMPPGRLESIAKLRQSGDGAPPPPPATDISGVHLFGCAPQWAGRNIG